jgi:hypothetical protein
MQSKDELLRQQLKRGHGFLIDQAYAATGGRISKERFVANLRSTLTDTRSSDLRRVESQLRHAGLNEREAKAKAKAIVSQSAGKLARTLTDPQTKRDCCDALNRAGVKYDTPEQAVLYVTDALQWVNGGSSRTRPFDPKSTRSQRLDAVARQFGFDRTYVDQLTRGFENLQSQSQLATRMLERDADNSRGYGLETDEHSLRRDLDAGDRSRTIRHELTRSSMKDAISAVDTGRVKKRPINSARHAAVSLAMENAERRAAGMPKLDPVGIVNTFDLDAADGYVAKDLDRVVEVTNRPEENDLRASIRDSIETFGD